MVTHATNGPPAVPSRNALRVLRRLALAGSTVGSFCTVAAITYDVHRRIRVAENIIENKRTLQTSAPNYDATSAARRMARMMDAAEAGEFMGLESLREQDRKARKQQKLQIESEATGRGYTHSAAEVDTPGYPTRAESFLESTRTNFATTFDPKRKPRELPTRNEFVLPEHMRAPNPLNRSKVPTSRPKMDTTPEQPMAAPAAPESQKQAILEHKMQELLEHERTIEAAQIFLEGHPASLGGISSERKEVAVKAFYANCDQENVFIARSVFERLEDVGEISLDMWKVLMFALAKKGCIESVATLYTRHMHKFRVPGEMVDIVLRCLLESHRLTTAKWFLFRHLEHDRDCGLCGAYLTGLWRKTRSIELLNGQLSKLLKLLARIEKQPSDKLFNPVLKAYVDFGRFADAEALVEDMTTTFNIPLRCRTKGLLLYGKALRCDWAGVELGLQEMYDCKLTTRRRDFLPIFDRIFLEYWVSHSGTEIHDFVFRCLKKFKIVPDKVLYKHILEAFVEKGDKDMIAELSKMAQEKSWNIGMKEKEFLEILRARRHALEGAPVGFWHMLQAARVKHGQASTSQSILGYDQHSFPVPEANRMPFSHESLPWHERLELEITTSKPVDQYQKLHKQMSHYIHVGKMTEALKCYKNAKNARFHVKQLHVELAAIATLLEHGHSAARALVEAEWRHIRDLVRFYPIFFRQIMEVDPASEGDLVKMAVLRFHELCATNKNLTVKHHITVASSRRLISQKKADIAVDLLSAVYMSRYRHESDFDAVCMKMFVRAFTETDNLKGIRWCLLTGLSRSDALSQDFVVEVRRIIGVLNRRSGTSPAPSKDAPSRSEQLEYLDFVADLLEKKLEGDPLLWELRPDPIKKRLSRRKVRLPTADKRLFRQSTVRDTIESWDEEYELAEVLGRADTNTASITAEWNETKCLGETWREEEASAEAVGH